MRLSECQEMPMSVGRRREKTLLAIGPPCLDFTFIGVETYESFATVCARFFVHREKLCVSSREMEIPVGANAARLPATLRVLALPEVRGMRLNQRVEAPRGLPR